MSSRIGKLSERLSIKDTDPGAYTAMGGLKHYVDHSEIPPLHRELIKIRASIVNGCAYCIHLHTADARKLGETEQRLYALSAWWESPLFTEEERVLFAMTDEVSLISQGGLSDETYEAALKHFGEKLVTQIIMQIITINAWNRVAISTHMVIK